jgi:hypothetical protein
MLKLANYLHVRTTNVFFTAIFRASLLPCLRLATINMRRNTLINHKETTIVCEESGPISLSYNVILTTPKANTLVKPIIPIVTANSTLTCTNCGKIDHSIKTYHN